MSKWFYKILFFFSVISFLSFYGCSGCSQSGIRNKQQRRNYSNTNRPTKNIRLTDDIKEKKLEKRNYTPNNKGLPLNELYKKCKSSVFIIYTSNGVDSYQGTGFFISKSGLAVSNYHVFKGTSKGLEVIETSDGNRLKIEKVLSKSDENDYIIFKVKLSNYKINNPISISIQEPQIGEDVFAIGNPRGLESTLSKGIVSGYRDGRKLIQTTTEITHGSSGGPLLNMRGEVIGITSSGLGEADLNFAVNIKILDLNKFTSQSTVVFQPNHSYTAFVKRVIDGDTFVLDTEERVRLIGMDTPETKHPTKEIQPFGPEASKFTKNAIEGKEVRLEFDIDLYDRYNRLLAYVYYNNIFLNEELILNGLAKVSTYPPNVKYVDRFLSAQNQSKASKLGMWAE